MLALNLAQYQPILITILAAFCVLKFLRMKPQHRPREFFKDESSRVDVDADLDAELQPLKPAFPATANVSGEEIVAANAALETKAALLNQLLLESDREAARLMELLHEARAIRIPGVIRDDDLDAESSDAESTEAETLLLSTAASEQTSKVNKQQFVRLLHQSGFSAEEVAKAVQLPIEIVLGMLGQSGEQDRAAG